MWFTTDPVVPWSIPIFGPIILGAIAVGIAVTTAWTYRDAKLSRGRKAFMIGLRLAALLVTILTLTRPALSWRDDQKMPSKLIVALDASKSMTIADEVNNRSRWAAMDRALRGAGDAFLMLRDKHNVTIECARFSDDLANESDSVFDAAHMAQVFAQPPNGFRTDFGQTLKSLAQKYGQERALRGLLILSDGADNGSRYPAQGEAARFRALGCPIFTFALGQEGTSSNQRDIGIRAAVPDPSPVPVKGKVTVRVTVDAPGFENAKSTLRLLFDGKEVAAHEVQLLQRDGNELVIEANAPATAGEIKLTVRIDPLPGEASTINNELTTYLTVSREGLSVLIVDRLRLELKYIRRALASDPRMRVFEAVRQTDDPPGVGDASLYDFNRQAYDVIIIGDVSARRLAAGQPDVLKQIEQLVRVKGTGLLMIGGADSFASGGWRGTPVADALPVFMDSMGESTDSVRIQPIRSARGEFIMRLLPDAVANEQLWKKLPSLPGYSKFGRRKDGAVVIGESQNSIPLLVRQDYGKGRSAALALDMTYLWLQLGQNQRPRTTEGQDAHARFWRQLVLYLAHQEETEGSVWIKPDVRRVPVGGKVPFSVGVRGKTGVDLPDAVYEIRAISPDGKAIPNIVATRDKDADRGSFWKTEQPGEYQLLVKATAKDVDGTPVSDEARARFLVYQDDTELLRPAADHQFLSRLAAAGGGRAFIADELSRFLIELPSEPLAQAGTKVHYWPDWRSNQLNLFTPILFGIFVALLSLEWGLRRWWGLV